MSYEKTVEKIVGSYLLRLFMNQDQIAGFQVRLNGFWSEIYKA